MNELGGSSLYLSANDMQLGRGETIADTARVLSRYVHCIMARVYKQKDVEDLAAEASVPVINGLSDMSHPMQILADLLTIQEKKGKIKGVKVAFIGDGNNVCNTLLVGCTKLGADISVACPKNYQPDAKQLSWAKKNAEASGSTITITEEPSKAADRADVVYTDVFVSMGEDAEREQRMKVFLPKYQVTEKLFSGASPDAIFMHDLPAHRNEEVAPAVIDGPRSVVWDQAENRMHTAKAVLSLIT
jgi:ornithine carbamoyltransferase